jgi:hypothetical protein
MLTRSAGCLGLVLLFLLLLMGLVAAEPRGAVSEETWETAHVEGSRVGWHHVTTEVIDRDGERRLRTTSDLDLTFRRNQASVQLRMEQGDETTAEGKVLAVFMRQFTGRGLHLQLAGALEPDGRMHVLIDNGRIDRRLRWPEDVLGLQARELFFTKRKAAPGDRFLWAAYDPTVNTVVNLQVQVHDREEVNVAGQRQRLLRVDIVPEKIEVPGQSVQLPATVWWLDDSSRPVRRQMELTGLGQVVLTRSTKEAATAALGATAVLPDVNLRNLIPLNRALPRPRDTRSAVYRITLRDDPEPVTAFVQDEHQDVRTLPGEKALELHVHPVRPSAQPRGSSAVRTTEEAPGDEYRKPSHFISCDDARVKALAAQAVGSERDPWRKALRIEGWVKQNLRVDQAAALAPASQIARDLRGDCRQAALLGAALCRAEGIPARTALGLLYVDRNQRPALGFHMWVEVWHDGHWLGLDGTLGLGGVGADHLKVSDHSWHETASLTPLLPLYRVLGKASVDLVRFSHEN